MSSGYLLRRKGVTVAREREASKPARRSHRAQYPTPGFYLFGFVLNSLAVAAAAVGLLSHFDNLTLVAFGFLSVLSFGVAIYASTLKPMEANKKTRKILVGASAGFGFILLVVQGLNLLMNPSIFF